MGSNGNQSFSPNPATVPAAHTVVWHNVDSVTRRVVLDDGRLDTGNIPPGAFSAPMILDGSGLISVLDPPVNGRRDHGRRITACQNVSVFAMAAASLFLAAVCGAALRGWLPPVVPIVYGATSVAAALVYAADKSAARRNQWRTPERTLHLLALVGGWPGALVAQTMFRHKSRKTSFRIVFWTTVVLNCAALAWWMSSA